MRCRALLPLSFVVANLFTACAALVGIEDVGPISDAAADAEAEAPDVDAPDRDAADAADACADADLESDPANCGACGHSCLGGNCAGRACEPVDLAVNTLAASGIAVDSDPGGWVYWTDNLAAGGAVNRVRKDGRAMTRSTLYVKQGDEQYFANLVLVGSRLYWPQLGTALGGVHSMQVDGSGHVSLPLTYGIGGVASDGQAVFAVNRFKSPEVIRIALDLSSPTTLHAEDVHSGDYSSPAVDPAPGGAVYWVGGGVHRVGKDGTGYAKLAPFGEVVVGIDATSAYFCAGFGTNSIVKIGKDGTCPASATSCPEVLATAQVSPAGFTVHPSGVYWTTFYSGTLMRVNKDGTNLTALATDLLNPGNVVLDAYAIYWAEQGLTSGTGRVRKLAR